MVNPPGREGDGRLELTGTDEWLLQAIRAASSEQKGATLAEVIGWGDALNHAIFTPAELRSGLAKLLAARFIIERDGRWFINEFERNPNVVANSNRVTDPQKGEAGWAYPLSEAAIQEAIRAYVQR